MVHTIAVLALDGVLAFDLSTPIEIFERACLLDGQRAYKVILCGPSPEIHAGSFTLRLPEQLNILAEADTIIVPGRAEPLAPVPDSVVVALRQAAARGTRIASICVGAFTLAAAGLLRGLRATTHWAAAGELARRYPDVQVDPAVLFVDNGQILTSAGAAAGLDLCLHIVRRDHGAAVAAHTAKLAVMPLERDGGQSQFIVHERLLPTGGTLEPLLRWMEANADRQLTLRDLADHVHMSTRTLSRRFHEEQGTTPLLWLNRVRLRQAQALLETTSMPVESIASRVGFGSLTAFRDRFKELVGVSPQAYRRTFRGKNVANDLP
jgi:transcriptional regulator GlxA family with amidase domain